MPDKELAPKIKKQIPNISVSVSESRKYVNRNNAPAKKYRIVARFFGLIFAMIVVLSFIYFHVFLFVDFL